MTAVEIATFGRDERLEVALHLKTHEGEITEQICQRCGELLEFLEKEESIRVLRQLVSSAVKSLGEGDLGYFLLTLIRLATRNLHLQLRINEVSLLGEHTFITLVEYVTANPSPERSRDLVEETYLKFTSDEVRVKLFQDYMRLQENVLFRQVEELSLLGQVSQMSESNLVRDAQIPERLLAKLMTILQADDGVAFFHSQFFRVIYSKLSGQERTRQEPAHILEIFGEKMHPSLDPQVLSAFESVIKQGFYWGVQHKEREINEMLEDYYPRFHANPPTPKVQRILDFDLDNPLTKICAAHSYMTYDLHIDDENYGLIFVNRTDPPDFTEEDFRFLTTFGGTLRQIVGNVILTNRLKEMATTDPLTGVNNRRQFETFMEIELTRASRYSHSVGLAMVDIDHFKQINDSYGHQVGDYVLVELCKVLNEGLRATEIISRYGGEEFAIIIPQADYDVTLVVGEKIRSLVEEHDFEYNGLKLPVTVSVGVALFPQMAVNRNSLVEMADKALYKAKRSGRNRVCMAAVEEN
ncbi:GGDEF domain-containing protein [bacterium]|nr:GGDEF domain-containing protein [bacterium]